MSKSRTVMNTREPFVRAGSVRGAENGKTQYYEKNY
jgi:hypothetical protein